MCQSHDLPPVIGHDILRMREIVARNEDIRREVWDRDEAVAFFRGLGEEYKAQLIAAIPQGEEISLYRQGEFVDLCRGPHVPHTGFAKNIKLIKVSGAYWRADPSKPQLQRIYGTAFFTKNELKDHLKFLEEAKKRNHRKLGIAMDLFSFHDEAPGMPFFHSKGMAVWLPT